MLASRNYILGGGYTIEEADATIRTVARTKPENDIVFPDYDGREKCTWSATGDKTQNPHGSVPLGPKGPILDSVLEAIGNTPIVRVSRFAEKYGFKTEILAKCEYFNAGGSVKDRIGLRMILEAEKKGLLQKGDYIIEPTSGNTGTGLALAAAIKGYKVLITLPEKMSGEKVNMMKALGAEILRTPTEAAWNAPESHIGLAIRLNKALGERSHILDQYKNIANPMAHYEWTGQEIVDACRKDGKAPDAVICSAGTGGTITGIARKIKEEFPDCIVVGVDPVGSDLALPVSLNQGPAVSYEVEGIGYDFIPTVLDRSCIDRWVKTVDTESFQCARDLIRYEGLLVGGSSGAAMAGVVQAIKQLGWENDSSKRVVTLLPDSSRNYMSKFIDDAWMIERGFLTPQEEDVHDSFQGKTVADLRLAAPVTVTPAVSCQQVARIMVERGYDQVPVVSETGDVLGVVTEGNLTLRLSQNKAQPDSSVLEAMYKKVRTVAPDTKLSVLSRILDATPYALVVQEQETFGAGGVASVRRQVTGVVTRVDLLKLLAN